MCSNGETFRPLKNVKHKNPTYSDFSSVKNASGALRTMESGEWINTSF